MRKPTDPKLSQKENLPIRLNVDKNLALETDDKLPNRKQESTKTSWSNPTNLESSLEIQVVQAILIGLLNPQK